MYSLEYRSIPFSVSAVSWAPRLNHGHMAARRWEHVVCIDGMLPWFEAMMNGHGLMSLLLRFGSGGGGGALLVMAPGMAGKLAASTRIFS
jgi:hypothetical protein